MLRTDATEAAATEALAMAATDAPETEAID